MPSLRDEAVRSRLILRLQSLTASTKPRWGSFNAACMLCHLDDTLGMALGRFPARPMGRKAFHHFPLKHLFIYVLPFPKGVPTSPELLVTAPTDFEADRRRVVESINRLAGAPDGKGPEHPFFGPLTVRQWNSLQWKHIDHHLRQFGC